MKELQQSLTDYICSLGPPTLRSEAELRKCIRRYRQRGDNNIFYLLVDVRKGPQTTWCHNLERHFGAARLTQQQLRDRIHPQWTNWYEATCEIIYRIGINQLRDYLALGINYSISVPLRQGDGKYYWYRQFTRPITFDRNRNVVQFVTEMRLLCAYDRLVPQTPKLVVGEYKGQPLLPEMQRVGHDAMIDMLLGLVPRSSITVLQMYRALAYHDGSRWQLPDKALLQKALGVKREALNKGIVRLMRSVRSKLPGHVTASLSDLVGFMNDLFGQPQKKANKARKVS